MSLPAKFHQYLLELRVTNSMQWQRMNRQTKFEQMTRKILTSRTQQTLYISYTLWSILIEFGVFIVVYIPFVGRTGTIQFTKISIENKSTFLVWHKKNGNKMANDKRKLHDLKQRIIWKEKIIMSLCLNESEDDNCNKKRLNKVQSMFKTMEISNKTRAQTTTLYTMLFEETRSFLSHLKDFVILFSVAWNKQTHFLVFRRYIWDI